MSDVFTLNTATAAIVKAQATALAAADTALENAIGAVAEAIRPTLLGADGKVCTFAQWEAVRNGFIAVYQGVRRVEEKTAANRWSVIAGYLADSATPLVKPKAGSKDSARMDAKRDKEAKARDAAIKAHKADPGALLAAAAKVIDKPDQYKVLKAAADKCAADAAAAAKAKAREHEAKLREAGREILKTATGAELEAIVAAMRGAVAKAPKAKGGTIPARSKASSPAKARGAAGAIGAMAEALV